MNRILKPIALTLCSLLIVETVVPPLASALTGGPTQPEFGSFTPVGTTDMVDPFTGDFTYNIPLMDVDGYPVNLAYRSGISMDQESSWVGLGWNLNLGSINRTVRGLPDDFNGAGDAVVKEMNIRENRTWGITAGYGVELLGLKKKIKGTDSLNLSYGATVNIGIFSNSYTGYGFELGVTPSLSAGYKGIVSGGLGLGLGYNSHEGVSTSLNASMSARILKSETDAGIHTLGAGASVASGYNSRAGLRATAISGSLTHKFGQGGGNDPSIHRMNGTATIPVGTQSYIPQVQIPFRSTSGKVRYTLGKETKVKHSHGSLEGYFSRQELAERTTSNPAYGYFYSQNGVSDDALLDFNREKNGIFTEKTPNLPVSVITYDIYSATGHGVSGMFRPFRGDIGVLSDAAQNSGGTNRGSGAELGIGDLVHIGLNYSLNNAESKSGRWLEDNAASDFYKFAGATTNRLYEPFYFKSAGEKTITDPAFDAGVGGTDPVRLSLSGHSLSSGLIRTTGITVPTMNNVQADAETMVPTTHAVRSAREKRQQMMTALTAAEASRAGLSREIEESSMNDFTMVGGTYRRTHRSRVASNGPAMNHHISEMTVLNPDGARYVYGIPAYNTKQKEVTFNVAGNGSDCETGLVEYGGTDNSINNMKGIDHYYSSSTLKPYAHSYLLTSVLSADYADRTGDGPTDDDGGKAIRLNYSRAHSGYQWRVPFEANKASHSAGLKSDLNDNKGSYLYGTKEIWYVHSIETRTQVAEFYLSPRQDGFGVANENGGINPGSPLYKLDAIKLFSKEDRIRNGSAAVPIKTVHFEYDYSLCPAIPNSINGGGKLTLRKVFFTYGNLPTGARTPYEFTYSGSNPSYNLKGYDRWGNYKPNTPTAHCNLLTNANIRLANPDDPYVEQNRATSDANASAWHLTQIRLPSKGTITITYESDDYAFVQNRRAMRMFKVLGVSDIPGGPSSDRLYDGLLNVQDQFEARRWLAVEIPQDITTADEFYNRCIAGQENALRYRFLVDVTGKDDYEFVSGYGRISDYEVLPDASNQNQRIGWIELAATTLRDKNQGDEAHPISKAAWELARREMTGKIFTGSDPAGEDEAAILGLVGMLQDIHAMIVGYNRSLRDRGFGKKFVPMKSTVRLMEPSRRRLGGGQRVKRIEVGDDWGPMGGGGAVSSAYGQTFTYTMSGNESNNEESSGVASYEPQVGGDENPFREPVSFTNENAWAPDDHLFLEKPFGESHFPDPSVGYRRVTVRDFHRVDAGTRQPVSSGKVVHEFYTAYDFPVIVRQTNLVPGASLTRTKPKFLDKLFKARSLDYLTASQGYAIEKSDMHGKLKSRLTYAEGETVAISGTAFFYRTNPGDATRLRNDVPVIRPDGSANGMIVGRDIDVMIDMRETDSRTTTTDQSGNLDIMTLGPAVVPIPTLWGKTTEEKTRFRSAVVTKAIYTYGILDSVVAYEDGASVSTVNLAWDSETGEVLLTRTANTFRDPVYNFAYPAHWAYEGMGPAYRTVGVRLNGVPVDNGGKAAVANVAEVLTPGDEILLGNGTVAWVLGIHHDRAMLVDREGAKIPTGSYNMHVVRSGRRNQPSVAIGTVTATTNPLASGRISTFTKVLDAEVREYTDRWQTACGNGKRVVPGSTMCDSVSLAEEFNVLLSGLAVDRRLLSRSLDLEAVYPGQYTGYRAAIAPAHVYNAYSSTPDRLDGQFYAYGVDGCTFAITCEGPIDWNEVTSFVIIPTSVTSNGYDATARMADGTERTVHIGSNCLGTVNCRTQEETVTDCGPTIDMVANPYILGIRGNWRQTRGRKYLVDRQPVLPGPPTITRTDGAYAGFSSFWAPPVGGSNYWGTNPIGWTWTAEVTKAGPYGFELENRDALDRYSGALYGYADMLPTAVAANARYRWIAFDGFEDYDMNMLRKCYQPVQHWNFAEAGATSEIDRTESHTGISSLRVAPGASAAVTRTIEEDCEPESPEIGPAGGSVSVVPGGDVRALAIESEIARVPRPSPATRSDVQALRPGGNRSPVQLGPTLPQPAQMQEYAIQPCDCAGNFSPEPGQRYVLSGWVKENLTPPQFSDGDAEVRIDLLAGGSITGTHTFSPDGLVIEGWRRIEGTFIVNPGATDIRVALVNPSGGTGDVWFDDLRIHPFDASLKTYVFDPQTLRLMAVLDDRNYAALYEYSNDGQLIRQKQETERGIVTVKESRSAHRKQ